jgi:basic membrane protein A
MKKLLTIIVAVLMLMAVFSACQTEKQTYEIAMVTDIGDIDDKSFNQGTYEGVETYAKANEITYKYYKPKEKSTDSYVDAIGLAIDGGAKIVVCPGFLFEGAVFKTQDMYPETKFILIDGFPNDEDFVNGPEYRIEDNVYSVIFMEEQVGFLAGVAAVKEGYTKLGYLGGMAVPAVIRYGYGFVQGAEYMAKQMGVESIEMMYNYTGNFEATPENQAMAASWYENGTEVIFAAGGKVGNSAMAAAEAAGKWVIGVDVDQSAESDTVITSARKELGRMVQDALTDYYAGNFKGGISETLGIRRDAVGMEMANARLNVFTQADYDALAQALIDDTDGVRTNILNDADVDAVTDIPTEIVTVNYVE